MELSLLDTLSRFKKDVNSNPQVQRVTKNWNVSIQLECLDSGNNYIINILSGLIDDIKKATSLEPHNGDNRITLRSMESEFKEIFDGRRNPALASLEGDLQIFGDERHSVKLDAITLILWGL